MLIIRLQRVGKKKFPTYRMVISEKTRDTLGTYLEELGTFNPHLKENQFNLKVDRIKYWISKGAQMSGTVNNLLVSNKIIEGKKKKSVYLSNDRRKKMAEKAKVKAEAAEKAKAEKPAAPAPAAPAQEKPVESPVAAPAPVAPAEEKPAEAPVTTPAETPAPADSAPSETAAA